MEACSSPLSARRIFHIPNGLLVAVPWPRSIASRIIDLVKPVAPLRPDRVCRLHYQYRCLKIQLLLERLPPSLRAIPLQRLGVEEPRSPWEFSGGTLGVASGGTASGVIFSSGGTLQLDSGSHLSGTISGFHLGEEIDLRGLV